MSYLIYKNALDLNKRWKFKCYDISRNFSKIVSIDTSNNLTTWDIEKSQVLSEFNMYSITSNVNQILFTIDDTKVITSSHNGNIILWDLINCVPIHVISNCYFRSAPLINLSLDGQYLIKENDCFIEMWNLNTLTRYNHCTISKFMFIYCVVMLSTTQFLVGTNINNAYLCNGEGEICQTYTGHTDTIVNIKLILPVYDKNKITFDCEEIKYFLSSSFDLTIKKWDLESGICISSFKTNTAIYPNFFVYNVDNLDNKVIISSTTNDDYEVFADL